MLIFHSGSDSLLVIQLLINSKFGYMRPLSDKYINLQGICEQRIKNGLRGKGGVIYVKSLWEDFEELDSNTKTYEGGHTAVWYCGGKIDSNVIFCCIYYDLIRGDDRQLLQSVWMFRVTNISDILYQTGTR